VVDFRSYLAPKTSFASVYAPWTTLNEPGRPARLGYYLAHRWSSARMPETFLADSHAVRSRLLRGTARVQRMTSTHFMNLIAALFVVATLAGVCRLAFVLAGRRHAIVIARDERSDPSQRYR
jgi:hypothetical protein